MLSFKNYNIYIGDKCLIKDINLDMNLGEIHVFMGKNGVGKSSLAKSIMGDSTYKVSGNLIYNNEDITNLNIYERSKRGIYYLNQNPTQIEGVTNAEMLRLAVSEMSGSPVNIFAFNKELESICVSLELDKSFIHKEINVGASGGERKKIELMHMWMLKPKVIILDEIDSGLDVDAIKLVSKSIKEYFNKYRPLIIIITHNSTLINTFDEFYTHLFQNNTLYLSSNKELAYQILNEGFKNIVRENVIREIENNE